MTHQTFDRFEQACHNVFGEQTCDHHNIVTLLQNACRGEGDNRDKVSIAKVNALIDMFNYYPILKRGQADDHRDLYKLMQTKPKMMRQSIVKDNASAVSEYQIAFSKSPDGIVLGLAKGNANMDPAMAHKES